jgi:hypothetical protein
MLTKTSDTEQEEVEAALRRHQRTPEEVARLAAGREPFSYAAWKRKARPATPEELADWEEFLRMRDAERVASLAMDTDRAWDRNVNGGGE